jgi:hypothetical protein
MTKNFGDFQWSVYGDALRGINSRYPSGSAPMAEGVRIR